MVRCGLDPGKLFVVFPGLLSLPDFFDVPLEFSPNGVGGLTVSFSNHLIGFRSSLSFLNKRSYFMKPNEGLPAVFLSPRLGRGYV